MFMERYRTFQRWEGLDGAAKLTAPEHAVINACRNGVPCELGDGGRPEGPDPARTIRAELLRYLILGGCDNCRVAETGVVLKGAYIRDALDLDFAVVNGQTSLTNCRFADAISALQTRFELLNLGGSTLPGLNAEGVEVTGNVILNKGFNATGQVDLTGAKIGGSLACRKGQFYAANGHALNAQQAVIAGSVYLREGCATGEIRLVGIRVGGRLDCDMGHFASLDGYALNAERAVVSGGVFFRRGFKATGEVRLAGARIGDRLTCEGGHFQNANGEALNAQRLRVKGSIIWRNVMVLEGGINIDGAHVGDLVDDAASWPAPDGTKARLILDGFTYNRISNFTDTQTRLDWLSAGTRRDGEFFPQPYAQLAKVLRAMGHDRSARTVIIEKEHLLALEQYKADRAKAMALWSGDDSAHGDIGWHWCRRWGFWLWNELIRRIVGYGYAPQYALYWTLAILTVLSLFYFVVWQAGGMVPNSPVVLNSADWVAALGADAAKPGPVWADTMQSAAHYETFVSGFYAMDVFIPLINFGQEEAWTATTKTTMGCIAFVVTFAAKGFGWFITALGAAAITGIIRRD
jgi:hypothetical protein